MIFWERKQAVFLLLEPVIFAGVVIYNAAKILCDFKPRGKMLQIKNIV